MIYILFQHRFLVINRIFVNCKRRLTTLVLELIKNTFQFLQGYPLIMEKTGFLNHAQQGLK